MKRTLVLSRSSLAVSLEGEHLVIRDHADASAGFTRVPLVDVERVVVCGQPSVSFPAFAKLMDMHIPCGFLTHGGHWRGMMDGDAGFHAGRRRRQYESMSNDAFRLAFAGRVIDAKLKNSRRTLQRLAANRNLALDGCSDWMGLDRCIAALPYMRTVVADRVALDLLNHRRLDPTRDFEPSGNGGVYLSDSGRPKVFRAFDEAIRRKGDSETGALSLRQRMDEDVCAFLRMLEQGESPRFFHAA